MKSHKYADLFPLLDPEQLRALVDDIRINGQREPIITWQGEIIDGRNRWAACELAGVAPVHHSRRFESEQDILAYVVSANIHRRHLSLEDKRGLLIRLAEEGKSLRQIAAATGVSKDSVARELQRAGVSRETPVTGRDGKTYPASRPSIQSPRLPREEAGPVLFDEAEARLEERRRQAESPGTFQAEPTSTPAQSDQDPAPPHQEPAHEEKTTTQEVAASVEAYFERVGPLDRVTLRPSPASGPAPSEAPAEVRGQSQCAPPVGCKMWDHDQGQRCAAPLVLGFGYCARHLEEERQRNLASAAAMNANKDYWSRARAATEQFYREMEIAPSMVSPHLSPIRGEAKGQPTIQPSAYDGWNTPPEIVERVRAFGLGSIELDPCSNPHSQVGAKIELVEAGNGLNQDWWGVLHSQGLTSTPEPLVFVNPPYDVDSLDLAVEQCLRATRCGASCLLLVPCKSDQAWFQRVINTATAICFIKGRVSFWREGAKAQGSAFACVLIYFGPPTIRFRDCFGALGACLPLCDTLSEEAS